MNCKNRNIKKDQFWCVYVRGVSVGNREGNTIAEYRCFDVDNGKKYRVLIKYSEKFIRNHTIKHLPKQICNTGNFV